MSRRALHAALLSLLLLASARGGGAADTPETDRLARAAPKAASLVLEVMSRPWAVEGSDGRQHIVYELKVSNVTRRTIRLDHIAVLDAGDGKPILSYDGREIRQRFQTGPSRDDLGRQLGPAESGVLFAHLALRSSREVPKAISHRLEATPGAGSQHPIVVNGGRTLITTRQPVVLGPPLRGRNYLAGDGCCDSIRHVRALLLLDGRLRLAQRFAIDWEQIDNRNRIFVGDSSDVHSYHIYGDEVLAVADGEIVALRDGMSDQVPHKPRPVSVEDADGNHVIQDIGNGAYVLYAHMKKGSVRSRVRVGKRVRKGQVIGLVGNTGNTIAPHLHLHVVDAPSALQANGIPHVFERFRLTGFDALGTADFDGGEEFGTPLAITPISPPSFHRRQLPLDLVVVDWLRQ